MDNENEIKEKIAARAEQIHGVLKRDMNIEPLEQFAAIALATKAGSAQDWGKYQYAADALVNEACRRLAEEDVRELCKYKDSELSNAMEVRIKYLVDMALVRADAVMQAATAAPKGPSL